MSDSIHFVYAVDKNYNHQLLISINSLLSKFTGKATIHIIHKDSKSIEKQLKKIQSYENLEQINVYQFIKDSNSFPNIEGTHISEATYYRLFINKYIPDDIDSYIYLDADIICLNDAYEKINKTFSVLKKSNYKVAARTEMQRETNELKFSSLGIKGTNYFNAGVLFVNNKLWRKEEVYDGLLVHLEKIKDKLEFWDQDVLNSFFEGYYLEIEDGLNNGLDLSKPTMNNQGTFSSTIFLHYQGSNKPWSIQGSLHSGSKYYHSEYNKFFDKKYHIKSRYSKGDLIILFRILFSGRIFSLEYPFIFFYYSLKAILR